VHGSKRSNLRKRTLKLKIQLFVLTKNLTKQLVFVAKSIFKFGDSQRKNLGRWVITYIGVGVRDVPRQLAHEAKASKVTRLALGPLILFGARGVIPREVEVAEGGTCSGDHLLELLLLLVPKVVLLLALALLAGVISVVVGNPIVRDALVLLIRSCTQGRQGKLQSRWVSTVGGVSHMATNTSTSNKSLTSKRSIMVQTTLPRQLMRFWLAKQFLSV
jgi:hypothetical protein